jgi:2'-5' RNA ligase
MRVFTALPVTEPAREQVVGLLGSLRRTAWPVRWVGEVGLHLTLKFLGEVPQERAGAIEEALRFAAEGTGPLPLRLNELGAFPTANRPRVLWVGVETPPGLELLQDRVERRLAEIGFPPEGRPFRPHITLGRVRGGQRLPPRGFEDFGGRFEPAPFLADRLVLYESVLTPAGPRYEALATLDLAP